MSKPLILLDVDGVICNFVQGMIDTHGWNIQHDQYKSWNYHRELGLTDKEFWEPTNEPGWWEMLKPYNWANELVEEVRQLGDIIFCTSPSQSSLCPSEKVIWLRAFGFLEENEVNYQINSHKYLNARPGVILIDDSDSNVKKYRDYGGRAVMFPQPWNSAGYWGVSRVSTTISILENCINQSVS